jgi:hypothetical protein
LDRTASEEIRSAFLKKRSKRLWFIGVCARRQRTPKFKSFLVLFFKKEQTFARSLGDLVTFASLRLGPVAMR